MNKEISASKAFTTSSHSSKRARINCLYLQERSVNISPPSQLLEIVIPFHRSGMEECRSNFHQDSREGKNVI
jgi:hypothetical protein